MLSDKTMPRVVMDTPLGSILGEERDGCIAWLGVRYAKAVRFGLPSLVESWQPDVYDATTEGPSCPQKPNSESSASQSEDCLFVNIWLPASGPPPNRTFAFIHGGGFTSGSIGRIYDGYYQYNGCRLAAERGIAVATIQYRLGVLGWLAKPVANLGLRDQAAALRFTRRLLGPVASSRVLLGGQSAGSISICAHLFAPRSRGLFDAVLMMSSNLCPTQPRFVGRMIADGFLRLSPCRGTVVAAGPQAWGARTLACLRTLNLTQILAAQGLITEVEEVDAGGWRLKGLDGITGGDEMRSGGEQMRSGGAEMPPLYSLQLLWSPLVETSPEPLDAAAAAASPQLHLGAPARVPVVIGEVRGRGIDSRCRLLLCMTMSMTI